jgi:hypothetical protein
MAFQGYWRFRDVNVAAAANRLGNRLAARRRIQVQVAVVRFAVVQVAVQDQAVPPRRNA